MAFQTERLSQFLQCTRENDYFNESPLIYSITCKEYFILVDSGCGTPSLLDHLFELYGKENILEKKILLINTHNHYDHVGANQELSNANVLLDICASDRLPSYTLESFNSLGKFVGCDVKPYKITRWIKDGFKINLDVKYDSGQMDITNNYVEFIHTPGHTPDSMCIYYSNDNCLFVGDFIYRFAAILAIGPKSSFDHFLFSTEKLISFVAEKEKVVEKPVSLCCGHNNPNLESNYLQTLHQLLLDVKGKKVENVGTSIFPVFASNQDEWLLFSYRRFMSFDFILNPFFKLFYR